MTTFEQLIDNNYLQRISSSNSSSILDFDSIETNITLAKLYPFYHSVADVTISSAFVTFFVILLIFVASSLIKTKVRKEMKRNQIIMVALVSILLLIQFAGVISKILGIVLNILIVSKYQEFITENYSSESHEFIDTFQYSNCSLTLSQVGVKFSQVVVKGVFESFECFFIGMNLVFMILIMTFVGNVFLETVKQAGSREDGKIRSTRWLIIILNTLTTLFCFSFGLIIVAMSFIYFFINIGTLDQSPSVLFLGGFLVYFIQICSHTIISCIAAFKVLQTIKSQTSKLSNQKSKTPFIKVITLQLTLTAAAFSQIISFAFLPLVDEWSYSSLFNSFGNSLGVLLFAITTILLYHPIFTDSLRAVKELLQTNEPGSPRSRTLSLFKKPTQTIDQSKNIC